MFGLRALGVYVFFSFSALFLAACATGPALVEPGEGGQQILAYDCNNIKGNQEPGNFETRFYMTTWGSVWSEALRNKTIDSQPASAGTSILAKMPPDSTYCMVLPFPFKSVTGAVAKILNSVDVSVEKADLVLGEFETTYANRQQPSQHQGDTLENDTDGSLSTKWKEKYYVSVSSNIESGTDIRVYRDVLISRPEGGEQGRYIRAESDGHNEAWILLKTRELLQTDQISR